MSCNPYREMLHLYRPGELGRDELRDLDDHLRTCAECAALKARIDRAEATFRALREFAPAAPDIDGSVEAIMEGLGDASPDRRPAPGTGWLDRLLSRFELPAAQFAGALAALLITGGFLVQQIGLLNDVSDLESRLAGAAPGRKKLEIAYVVPPLPQNLPHELDRMLRVAEGSLGPDARGRIVVSRDRAADLRRTLFRQGLTSVASEKLLALNRKTLDDIDDYLNRNINIALRMTRRGGFR